MLRLYDFAMQTALPCSPPILQSEDKYQRDLKEDLKTALDLIYDLKGKLHKLHPSVIEIVSDWMAK